jgi:clathrin heavy chain
MARKTLKERAIDSALVYALAQTHKLGELEAFVTSPNVADIQHVGDRAFEETLYEAARVIYTSALNFPRLASTLVALGLYREACDAAKKANSVRTWKEVNAACVKAGEFKLAQAAGLHIIVSPDHMEDLLESYESAGHWEELIRLLEQGIALEGAHQGIFTELGVMYSRYRPEALMSHVRANVSRINTSKMLRACESGRHWQEACFILTETEDFDGAVKLMMEHSPVAFAAERFMEIISRVRNSELYFASLSLFVEE